MTQNPTVLPYVSSETHVEEKSAAGCLRSKEKVPQIKAH